MPQVNRFLLLCFALLLIYSCSKKHHPTKTENNPAIINKTDTVAAKKTRPRVKTAVPKVIVVNDNAATKSIDGRLYYDLEGHRYWKNYKDGKYYLYNQSMYSNNDFKPK